jgi:hypothetical protein
MLLEVHLQPHFRYSLLDYGYVVVVSSDIDHAASTDSGWGCSLQVLHFEEHSKLRPKLNSLSVGQAESHVVIEDCIEVFNPHGIDRTIKSDPVEALSLVIVALSHNGGKQAITPFLRKQVNLAIELSHSH